MLSLMGRFKKEDSLVLRNCLAISELETITQGLEPKKRCINGPY